MSTAGLDAGPDTIAWHLTNHHATTVSVTTVSRHLTRAGLVTPQPKKRPKSSYIRFQAAMPNETWQSDFTHYRLTHPDGTPGTDTEILTWLDYCSRYALRVTAHLRVTGPTVLAAFRSTLTQYGIPASTLTDNGMVYTTRFAGGRGGQNALSRTQTTPRHPEELPAQSPHHLREGRTLPTDHEEMAPSTTSAGHTGPCRTGPHPPPPPTRCPSSPSTPARTTSQPEHPKDPPGDTRNDNSRTHNRGSGSFRSLERSHGGGGGI